MTPTDLKNIIEAILLVSHEPLSVERMDNLFMDEEGVTKEAIKTALTELSYDYRDKVAEVKELGSGVCIQVRPAYATWVSRLWEERPPRFSRALLETLSLIAYRQPITRAEIEDIRGVSVSTNIIKTLLEREWVQIIGHKEVPGRPALFATTKQFLDHFNLKNLSELPELAKSEASLTSEVEISQENPEKT